MIAIGAMTAFAANPDSIAVYDTATVYTPPPYHDDCANAAFFPCGSPPATVSTLAATQDTRSGFARWQLRRPGS